MKLNGRSILKGIVKFVGSMGVGALVSLGVKQNIIPVSKYDKIMCAIGSFVLSDMISTKAEEYLDQQCDSVFDTVDSVKNILEDAQNAQEQGENEYTSFGDEFASLQDQCEALRRELLKKKTIKTTNGEETSWPKEI